MEKSYVQPVSLERPVCHQSVHSKRHAARCGAEPSREIVEVRPPNWDPHQLRRRGAEPEHEFFPLVSAAHEFKTPLVVMLGYADLLRTGHLGAVNDRQKQVLGEIQESAE